MRAKRHNFERAPSRMGLEGTHYYSGAQGVNTFALRFNGCVCNVLNFWDFGDTIWLLWSGMCEMSLVLFVNIGFLTVFKSDFKKVAFKIIL